MAAETDEDGLAELLAVRANLGAATAAAPAAEARKLGMRLLCCVAFACWAGAVCVWPAVQSTRLGRDNVCKLCPPVCREGQRQGQGQRSYCVAA